MTIMTRNRWAAFLFWASTLSFFNPSAGFATGEPSITSILPLNAPPGTPLIITGTNFNITASSNVVYFGATRGNVIAASATNLLVTTPAGATFGPVSVTINGLTAQSNQRFLPTFPGDGTQISSSSFGIRQDISVGSRPGKVIIADIDGDGKPDLVVAEALDNSVSIYRNINTNTALSTNSFASRVSLKTTPGSASTDPWSISVADVNGDGKLDIVALDADNRLVSIFINIGSPGNITTNSFGTRIDLPAANGLRGVAIGDLDGDGRPEIVTGNQSDNTISIFQNFGTSGNITFAPRVDLPAGNGASEVVIADLDGDGKPDLAVANYYANSISVYRNVITSPGTISTGSFVSKFDYAAPSAAYSLMAADVDGDGKLDLISGASDSSQLLSLYQNVATAGDLSTNSFQPRIDFALGGHGHTMALGDLNGDAKADIAISTEINSYLSIFQNTAAPGSLSSTSLAARVDLSSGWNAWGVSVGDLDGDGRPDIVFCNAYDNTISIYQNQTSFGPLTITVNPTNSTVAVGNTAILAGSATGQGPLSYQWYFNGTNLTNGGRISGSDVSTLIISNAQVSDSGSYYFVVTNTQGSSTSLVASLNVQLLPPTISQQPVSQTNLVGSNTIFSATFGGSLPMAFQWFTNGVAASDNDRLSGATTTSLTVSNTQTNDIGTYFVVATNVAGAVTSAVVSLSVAVPPHITQQPSNQIVIVGSNAVFTVIADGLQPLTYQWYFGTTALSDNTRITGATNASLTISNVQTSDAGNYQVITSDAIGTSVPSASVLLTVVVPPAVVLNPISRSVPPGLPTTLSASFSGTSLQFQWQLNGTNVPGATASTYSIPAVNTNDLGVYHLIASNTVSGAMSADARLTLGNVAAWGRNVAGETLPPPDLTNAICVAGPSTASLAVRADGSMAAWGLGAATNIPASASNVVAISGNVGISALRSDGTVSAWGGLGGPIASNLVAIAVANTAGIGLRAEGTVIGWGTGAFVTVPTGLNHVTAVAVGYSHALALKEDGTLVTWGSGTVTNLPTSLTNVVGIAAGYTHSLALKRDGTLVAWGIGTSTNIPTAATNIAAISAGFDPQSSVSWNFAIRSNGTIIVWGNNSYGETNPPTALTNLVSVAATPAVYHMLDIVNDGTPLIIHPPIGRSVNRGRDIVLHGDAVGAQPLYYQWFCNGTNIPGANGATLMLSNVQFENSGIYQLQVSNVLGVANSLAVPLNVVSNTTLTLLSQPLPQTNNCYQGGRVALSATVLGNGPLTYQWYYSRTNSGYTPVNGATNETLVLEPALAIQSGNYYLAVSNQFNYATSSPAAVKILFARGWGFQPMTNPPVNVTNAIAVTTSGYNSYYGLYLALGTDGKVAAWATYSPVYYGETNVSVLSNSFVTAIAAGYQHGLALKSDGTVYGWGYTGYGQTNPPSGLNNVTAIACGDYHDVALKADGTIVAWGQNTYGEGTNSAVATNTAVAIAAGTYHNLGLRADGTVFGWGYNGYGQINIPAAATNVIAIAAGGNHSVALRANGTVIGWGNNINGQITFPTNLTNVVGIAAASSHTTVLRADGTVASFGYEYQSYASNNTPADLANVVAISGGGEHDFGLLGNRAPAFTVQPWNRNFNPNTSTQLVLTAKCAGAQPLSYQWLFNGTNLPGATNDSITLTNFLGQPSRRIQAGNYQLLASNVYGVAISKSTKVSSVIPLSESLDAANLNWTSTSTSWFGQTNFTHDGVDAARSGGIGALQETILQTTVATNWPGRYTFWWKVSSEQYFDTLEFRINGISQTNISGEVDWQPVSVSVPAGTNVLQWRYSKDSSFDSGLDAGFVDQFAFIPNPPVITVQPAPVNQTVNLGANVSYSVSASGGTIFYRWNQNGTSVVGGNNSTLSLNSVGRAQNGNYFVIVTNSGGAVTSSVVSLKVLVPQLLGAPTISPDGKVTFNSTDADGGLLSSSDLANFEAQASTNLTDWITLTNALSLTNGMLQMQDPDQTNNAARFYRLIEH